MASDCFCISLGGLYVIYDRIRELANLKGIKMTDIAKATGISVNTMKNWNKSAPKVTGVQIVAEYFGVSVDYLIGRSDDPFSHNGSLGVSHSLIQGLESLANATQQVQGLIGGILEQQNGNIDND